MIKSVLIVLLPIVFSFRLRSQGSGDFGCSDANNPSCIKPDPIAPPTPLNPASITTSTDQNGFLTATSQDGDMPDAVDKANFGGTEEDLAAEYLIASPQLSVPDPPGSPITCTAYDTCTTTPNPDLQSSG